MLVAGENAIPLAPLVRLCHHGRAPAVVAALWETRGAKFVTLAQRLGIAPEGLSRTLAALEDLGLVMRNPGYGHPMRPEYLLAPDGESAAPAVRDLVRRFERAGIGALARRKWTAPTLAAAGLGATRFSGFMSILPGVTPRALTQTLAAIEVAGLVERRVIAVTPPRSDYRLTRRGGRLASASRSAAEALALIVED